MRVFHLQRVSRSPVDETLDLKARYQDVFADYQRLPLRLDTTSSIRRHALLTDELVAIERDMSLLEKHQQIFIDSACRHSGLM